MSFGVGAGIGNIVSRLKLLNANWKNVLGNVHVLNTPIIHQFIDKKQSNIISNTIIANSLIYKAVEISFFDSIKKSGKVDYQKGGGFGTIFQLFILICALASAMNTPSNDLVVHSQNMDKVVEWSNKVITPRVSHSVSISGAAQIPILFGLTFQSELNVGFDKIFADARNELEPLIQSVRGECLKNIKQYKGSLHPEYTNLINGETSIELIAEPPKFEKDTQTSACFGINPLPFHFNKETGNIDFVNINMPLNQVTEILYTIVGDMNSIMQTNPSKEVVKAYNGLVALANGMEEIEKLLFNVFSPVVFDSNMPNKYRLDTLERSFNAIIKEMEKINYFLSLTNPAARMEAASLLAEANEKLENEKMIADARTAMREAKNIESDQNVKDSNDYYGNKVNENMAFIRTIGKKTLEIPVDISEAVSNAAVKTVLAPVNSILNGATELIMNNKLIAALAAIGVLLAGVVTIKIASEKLTIIYKVGNAIKTVVLLPITVPIWIGKTTYSVGKKIKVLLYRSEESSNPNVPLIDNGPIDNGQVITNPVNPVVVTPVNPVVVTPVAKKLSNQELEKLTKQKIEIIQDIESKKAHLANYTKSYNSNIANKFKDDIHKQMIFLDSEIAKLNSELDEVETKLFKHKAKGTRKRIKIKNTKKNKNKKRNKPSRKFKLRK